MNPAVSQSEKRASVSPGRAGPERSSPRVTFEKEVRVIPPRGSSPTASKAAAPAGAKGSGDEQVKSKEAAEKRPQTQEEGRGDPKGTASEKRKDWWRKRERKGGKKGKGKGRSRSPTPHPSSTRTVSLSPT